MLEGLHSITEGGIREESDLRVRKRNESRRI